MATIDPATFFTFNSPLKKKSPDKLSVTISEADVAAFQLAVGGQKKPLFSAVTTDMPKEAWPKITDLDKIVWDDLVFI